jgi:hypothetical protein
MAQSDRSCGHGAHPSKAQGKAVLRPYMIQIGFAECGFEGLVGGFELVEAAFEVPLLGGFFAGVEEVGAGLCGFVGAEWVFGAGGGCGFEIVAGLPEAFAGLEAVFHSGSNHLF